MKLPVPESHVVNLSRLALAMVLAAGIALVVCGSRAEAGIYQFSQCSPAHGSGRAEFGFSRTSPKYHSAADCGRDGSGLRISHDGTRESRLSFGQWRMVFPASLELVRLQMRAKGITARGHKPEIRVLLPDGSSRRVAYPRDAFDTFRWEGAARELVGRLQCIRDGGCASGGDDATLRLRTILATVRDSSVPAVTAAVATGEQPVYRDTVDLVATATDSGGGVREIAISVNGQPLVAGTAACDTAGGIGTMLSPCPSQYRLARSIDTRQSPWRQGVNRVTTCASDFATSGNPNRTCTTSTLRIDNACPVSGMGTGASTGDADSSRISFRLGGPARLKAQGRFRVEGRLVTEGGAPVVGAEVCVATRAGNRSERVVSTPRTGSDGRFSASLPRGPGRQVRVAHWSTPSSVTQAFRSFKVKARPVLSVRPGRTLRNGDVAVFRIRLPKPDASGRRVVLEVRNGNRWQPLRAGRTRGHGYWRGSYRFRGTTTNSTYRFRARVPRQSAYGYEAGKSETVRIRVRP